MMLVLIYKTMIQYITYKYKFLRYYLNNMLYYTKLYRIRLLTYATSNLHHTYPACMLLFL